MDRGLLLAADEQYCPQCREIIKVSALKCRFCGNVLSVQLAQHIEETTPLSNPRMMRHVNILAYGALAIGLLFLLAAVAALLPKSSAPPGTYVPSGIQSANPAMAQITFILFVVPCLLIFFGLKYLKPWGRTISIGLAILTLAIPVSWYALWVLTQDETKRLFRISRARSGNPLRTFGYVVFFGFAVLVNIGFVSGFVKSITGPSATRVIPIADVSSGEGSDTGYCGMDADGKLTQGRPVSIEGTVSSVNSSNRTYVLKDATSGIMIVVNREFPPPKINEPVHVMGIVQCPPLGSYANKLVHELMRSPPRSAH
jgi:hypothetical protein